MGSVRDTSFIGMCLDVLGLPPREWLKREVSPVGHAAMCQSALWADFLMS